MVETSGGPDWDQMQQEMLYYAAEILDAARVEPSVRRRRQVILSAPKSLEEAHSASFQETPLYGWLDRAYRRLQAGELSAAEEQAFDALSRYWLCCLPRLNGRVLLVVQAMALQKLPDADSAG